MEAAIFTGAVSVLLLMLSRVPAFNADGRRAAQLDRDAKLLEKLPVGTVGRTSFEARLEADLVALVKYRDDRAVRAGLNAQTHVMSTGERVLRGLASVGLLIFVGLATWSATHTPAPENNWLWVFIVAAAGAVIWVMVIPAAQTLWSVIKGKPVRRFGLDV